MNKLLELALVNLQIQEKKVRKEVIRNGKKTVVYEDDNKLECPDGYKKEGNRCVKMTLKERRDRSIAATKSANKLSTKRNQRIARERRNSLVSESAAATAHSYRVIKSKNKKYRYSDPELNENKSVSEAKVMNNVSVDSFLEIRDLLFKIASDEFKEFSISDLKLNNYGDSPHKLFVTTISEVHSQEVILVEYDITKSTITVYSN